MALSRSQIEQLFLKDAERSKAKRDVALESIKTAETGEGRLPQIAAGALGGLVTGGPVGAGVGALGAATGKGDILESALGGVTGGVAAAQLPTGGLEALTKIENLPRVLPVLEQVGVPSKTLEPLKKFSEIQVKKQELETKKAEEKAKVDEERAFKREEAEKERISREKIASAKLKQAKGLIIQLRIYF